MTCVLYCTCFVSYKYAGTNKRACPDKRWNWNWTFTSSYKKIQKCDQHKRNIKHKTNVLPSSYRCIPHMFNQCDKLVKNPERQTLVQEYNADKTFSLWKNELRTHSLIACSSNTWATLLFYVGFISRSIIINLPKRNNTKIAKLTMQTDDSYGGTFNDAGMFAWESWDI